MAEGEKYRLLLPTVRYSCAGSHARRLYVSCFHHTPFAIDIFVIRLVILFSLSGELLLMRVLEPRNEGRVREEGVARCATRR